jgi:spermidine synthase
VSVVGIFVGLEIPLLMRILRDRFDFKDVVANVLTFDYLGALGASLLFPLVLVPKLGLVRSALFFGMINALVALWSTWLFRDRLGARRALQGAGVAVLLALSLGMWKANDITNLAEESLYADEVILSRNTRYQRIVLTAWKDDVRLFLNGHLQFSSRDEYRYHEALVHPGLAALPGARRVLVLGGGDGLAVREVLKYPSVRDVHLVDLDVEMTTLFTTHPRLAALNARSLSDRRVHVVNDDAFVWLDRNPGELFDFIVVDFPDPSNYAVGKLYTVAFYQLLAKHLSRDGLAVVQSTSPLFARQSYWSIVRTLQQAGLATSPYHLYVPSFGEWGFVLAGTGAPYRQPTQLPAGLRYLTTRELPQLFTFSLDMLPVPAEPNRLNDQALVRYYEEEWSRINR